MGQCKTLPSVLEIGKNYLQSRAHAPRVRCSLRMLYRRRAFVRAPWHRCHACSTRMDQNWQTTHSRHISSSKLAAFSSFMVNAVLESTPAIFALPTRPTQVDKLARCRPRDKRSPSPCTEDLIDRLLIRDSLIQGACDCLGSLRPEIGPQPKSISEDKTLTLQRGSVEVPTPGLRGGTRTGIGNTRFPYSL